MNRLQQWNSYRISFLLHTTTARVIIAASAITPNVTPSPIDKLPVSEAAVWIFCTALAGSAVVEAVKNYNTYAGLLRNNNELALARCSHLLFILKMFNVYLAIRSIYKYNGNNSNINLLKLQVLLFTILSRQLNISFFSTLSSQIMHFQLITGLITSIFPFNAYNLETVL